MLLKTRREFLRSSILGGALTWTLPSFLAETMQALHAAADGAVVQKKTGKDSTILVVLQMAGGNDGLNTVVPRQNDHYYRARPHLAVQSGTTLRLNDDFGLHPALTGFKDLYDAGHLGIVHGAGYPNPNRSHFRSTEIWQTASDSNRNESDGWLGRYFDNACPGSDPVRGICIGRQMPQAFAGPHPTGICLESPERYRPNSTGVGHNGDAGDDFYHRLNMMDAGSETAEMESAGASIGAVSGPAKPSLNPLDFIERVALDAQVSSEKVREVAQRVRNQATYPAGQLANSLRLVAQLIGGGMPTRVYYVSQGGYDTHGNQANTHQRLLSELGGSLKAFIGDLQAQGNLDRVTVMTFSEFGRRLAENANGGTDHGAAAPLFVAGAKVKAGLLGRPASLAPGDLFNGDPRFTVDFRSVYAGLLEDWLGTPSEPILRRKFEPLHCV